MKYASGSKISGLILAAAALGVGVGEARTVAWYHFDEVSPGTPVVSSDTFYNAADPSKLPGKPYSMGNRDANPADYLSLGDIDLFMPAATNDAPDMMYVIDPVGGTTNRNERSLHFKYGNDNTAGYPARFGGCVKVDSDSSLSLPNLTVELLVRPVRFGNSTLNGWTLVSKQTVADKAFTYSICVHRDGKPYVNIYNSSGTVMPTSGQANFSGSRGILDGHWHHIALTVSGRTAKLYVDYFCEKTITLETGGLYYVDNGPLYIGACRSVYKPGGFIDEVRISDEELTGPSFLRFFNAVPSFQAGFENSLDAELLHVADSYGVGTADRAGDSWDYPVYTNDVTKARIVNGPDNAIVRKSNDNALYVRGGQVKYPHNADLEMNEMTVECFMKYKESTNYGALLRFNQATNNWGTTPIWGVFFQDGELKMRIDTTVQGNNGHSFGSSFCDGEWHHLGITFKQFANSLSVAVFDNYSQVGSWWVGTDTGCLEYKNGSCLGINTTVNSNYVFSGFIDELRISQGVLPVEYFMRGVPKPGSMLVIW